MGIWERSAAAGGSGRTDRVGEHLRVQSRAGRSGQGECSARRQGPAVRAGGLDVERETGRRVRDESRVFGPSRVGLLFTNMVMRRRSLETESNVLRTHLVFRILWSL